MILLILAGGIGSRFGGLKQIEPVGKHNELIIDYSIYDARQAGFSKVVFVIRKEIEEIFKERIFNRIQKQITAEYVFQDKPLGTGHAVLAAKDVITEPFCIINADDFYGREGFLKIAKNLPRHCMVGFLLGNTVSQSGSVSRGVCEVDGSGMLLEINERKRVEKLGEAIGYVEDKTFYPLAFDKFVNVNMFGLTPNIFPLLQTEFAKWELGEFGITTVLSNLIKAGSISIKALTSKDRWLGFTYKEDKKAVVDEIAKLVEDGVYPSPLWVK